MVDHIPNNKALNVAIGTNLRALREMKGETQKALAYRLGVTFQQLQKYERGQNRLSAERLHQLHEHFKVPYDYFFSGLSGHAQLADPREDTLAIEAFRLIYNHKNSGTRQKILEIIRILVN